MALSWWWWLIVGSAFMVIEIITPGGFYILFFGIGAVVVGLLAAAGIAGPPWLQWLLFAVISVMSLLLFRRPLLKKLEKPDRAVDSIVGEVAVAMSEIQVSGIGKAELRGSVWNARNIGSALIIAGQRCIVERVDGLMLHVRG
jgi:hypothetical protein